MIALQVQSQKGNSLSAQLVHQLRRGILAGKILSGEKLPSVREVASQLKIHPLTIAKAYAVLENEGLVQTWWGKGTFVVDKGKRAKDRSGSYVGELVSKFIDETLPLVKDGRELKTIFEEQLRRR